MRCNAVSPGMVMSETALATVSEEFRVAGLAGARSPRLGRPSDLAATAVFLLSDDAEWVNGQVWAVDGGAALRDRPATTSAALPSIPSEPPVSTCSQDSVIASTDAAATACVGSDPGRHP